MPAQGCTSSTRLRLPEGNGCWVEEGPQIWRTLQPHDDKQTGHSEAPFGVFALGFGTTVFDTPLSGIAFFAPRVDGDGASCHPQVNLAEGKNL